MSINNPRTYCKVKSGALNYILERHEYQNKNKTINSKINLKKNNSVVSHSPE